MNKLILWLSGILALQLVIAVSLKGEVWQPDTSDISQTIFDFDSNQIDKIDIKDGEQTLSLVKSSGQWVLPDYHQSPVDQNKLNEVKDKLLSLQSGWPVATTQASHQRFEVAENSFQRHVKLFSKEQVLGEVYLGTSPGFRQVHYRLPDQESVYTGELNVYDFPVGQEAWMDKKLLAVKTIEQIQGADFTLSKEQEDWSFSAVNQTQEHINSELDKDKAQELVNAFSKLNVTKISEKKPTAKGVELAVVENGKTYHYRFVEENEDYFVSRDDKPHMFNISKYEYEKFAGAQYQELAKQVEQPESEAKTNTESNS
ncbi:DUF4340 domain-containing protein [Paraglaciecola aquimarina]|uniref:DUF4340 domain-containing protein n=1 Tax=Paraglaciecola algarum TaxID=3050085 RepID=A0ABS9D4H3_9ALTE|nr:DUF4340 domain-containing protein [Paraglaciecola sp. G1-23]MCF2947823.1 DUF4340 domain-containing protein [Paraglaciecola sp. G1-23]